MLSYPPVIFVLLPDVFVCVFVSLAESATTGLEIIAMVISIANKIKFFKNHFIVHFPYPQCSVHGTQYEPSACVIVFVVDVTLAIVLALIISSA